VASDGTFVLSGAGPGNSSWGSIFSHVEGRILPGRIVRITKLETTGFDSYYGTNYVDFREAANVPFDIPMSE
jgi:hypothetical protein